MLDAIKLEALCDEIQLGFCICRSVTGPVHSTHKKCVLDRNLRVCILTSSSGRHSASRLPCFGVPCATEYHVLQLEKKDTERQAHHAVFHRWRYNLTPKSIASNVGAYLSQDRIPKTMLQLQRRGLNSFQVEIHCSQRGERQQKTRFSSPC